jgi:hypothetical protein
LIEFSNYIKNYSKVNVKRNNIIISMSYLIKEITIKGVDYHS